MLTAAGLPDTASIGEVVNRNPQQGYRKDWPSPGDAPRTQGYLDNYREYTPLEEWESVTKGLAKEACPSKRSRLSDYKLQEANPSSRAAPKEPLRESSAVELTSAIHTKSQCDDVERSPNNTSTMQVPCVANKDAEPAMNAGMNSREDSEESHISLLMSHLRLGQDDPGLNNSGSLPRALHRNGGVQDCNTQVLQMHADSISRDSVVEASGHAVRAANDPCMTPRIHMVQAGALALKGNKAWQELGGSLDKRHVVDKEQRKYPSPKEIRPARKTNAASRRRLNSLLQLPRNRIEASEQHPSRIFSMVPSQNLRIT